MSPASSPPPLSPPQHTLGPDPDVAARLTIACEAADAAGRAAMAYFGAACHADDRGTLTPSVDHKADGSLVTDADRAAEQAAMAVLARDFADDGVLGEESGEREGSTPYRWIVDPIDGTISFVQGVPLWGTLIGLMRRGEDGSERAVAGVVHMPALGETVYAAVGGGAWWRPNSQTDVRPAQASQRSDPAQSVLLVTGVETVGGSRSDARAAALTERFGIVRGWSDCYAHVLVATGRAEVCIEPVLAPWDVAAALAVLPEAGAVCTPLEGQHPPARGAYLIAARSCHGACLAVLAAR